MSRTRLRSIAPDGATNGQTIVWNAAMDKWVPAPSGGGGAAGSALTVARVYATAAQAVPAAGTNVTITFGAETFDDNNLHDLVTNPTRITVPSSGDYEVVGQVAMGGTPTTGHRVAALLKNGATLLGVERRQALNPTDTQYIGVTSGVVRLTAGDYVELVCSQSSGGAVSTVAGDGVTFLTLKAVVAAATFTDLTATGNVNLGNAPTDLIGFYGATPIARPSAMVQTYSTADSTLGAYAADAESVAYTGLAAAAIGTPYAAVADLNALRVAYENLRVHHEDLAQFVNALVDKLQAEGLIG